MNAPSAEKDAGRVAALRDDEIVRGIIAQAQREAKAEALREAARYFEYEMAPAWGGDATWISTGAHVADLVAEHLRNCAASLDEKGQADA